MNILESLLSGLAGSSTAPGQSAANPMLQLLLQMLSSNGQFGGLSGLAQQFQQAGLGAEMNSWISTGQNLPISPDQLMQVFGQGQLQQLAASSGMDLGSLSGGLADLLPQMIDRMTPQGQVPAAGFDGALAELSKMMPRG
jgi:uncharacterized protein YidB (DUF937 family)